MTGGLPFRPMFSYRHGFHAGNHADVLKHTVLIALLRYLTEKDAALMVLDTHAGAGLYRLDGDYAQTSGEADEGIHRLLADDTPDLVDPLLQDYATLIAGFNPGGKLKVYPGSPFIAQSLLRAHDKLKLFELHPADARALSGNIAQLDAGRQVSVLHEDGFESVRKLLPPPSRRALLLCDPSYEVKTDYGRVLDLVTESLKRFPTGTYAVWYPVIPRPEAHDLPRRLKTLVTKSAKPWLHATLTVKSGRISVGQRVAAQTGGRTTRPGLPASGMFIVNPPYTLAKALRPALAEMAELLGQDGAGSFTLEHGG